MREFRRNGRRGAKLCEAAKQPMCIAVFGASQAGKSYLVSRLAAPPGGKPLEVRFDDRTLDFLKEINPVGGQESTGLVSRFTTRPGPAPPGAPVALRLLTQTDVVKILSNTFLEDFESDAVPDAAILAKLFERLTALARPAPVDTLTADDVDDMAEYFERHFGKEALLQQLNAAGYWPAVANLAPRLSIADRSELFAPLWGGTKRFTELYAQFVNALAGLRFAEVVHCGLDALVPRETSLIDARQLFSIGTPPRPEDMLAVTVPSGSLTKIGRPLLAALVAEMTVPLAGRPWPFFDTTDLLDFPGARTREDIVDVDKFLAQPQNLGFALLRGKVAYLFQRYNAEHQITSMLLCVGPSTQEVQALPRMVKEWIDQTIGPTPPARARQGKSLFFVLTKFDAEFEEKAGLVSSGTRWTARLQASLTDFFKAYDWPEEWTPGHPFDNIYWLRNPSIGFGAVFEYGPPLPSGERGPEISVAPGEVASVAQKREAYLANDLVRRHIADPAAAWEAGLAPNDGGIVRLAEALGPLCDPALKSNQIAARVEDLAAIMAERLRPLWRSDDRAAELATAKRRAQGVLRALYACTQVQMFCSLLRALQITTEQVAGIHWRMQTEPDSSFTPIGTVAGADEYESELAGLLGEAPLPGGGAGRHDYFEHFAGMVVAAWDEVLGAFAANTPALAAYRVPPEEMALLVGQIGAAARRTDLRGRIAELLREHANFHGRANAGVGKFVLIAEDIVNGFVTYLGFDRIPEARRPVAGPAGPGQRRIFGPRAAVVGLPPLTAQPSTYDRTFYVDWMTAFSRTMEDNVSDRTAEDFDREANDALGAMIRRLASAKIA